jgi:hypothetical protein
MGAIGTAVSVVGGIAGMAQQSSAASAQKRQLASQERQQALQAELQYLSIKNQAYADQLADAVNEQVRSLSYQQSQANLRMQQQANDIAVQGALFDAEVQKATTQVQYSSNELNADEQKSQANAQAGAQQLQSTGAAIQDTNSVVDNILKGLAQGSDQNSAIANLLDIASASGGVNEAIAMLSGGDVNQPLVAAANLGRQNELTDARMTNAGDVAGTSRELASATRGTQGSSNALGREQGMKQANDLSMDASTSKVVADQGFKATTAANEATNTIGILSDRSASASRKYLSAANLKAVEQGAALQSDIINAQKSQIKTPSFFDYAGVAINGYNTFKALQ